MAVIWGQVLICASGCCCGREDKGAAPVPLEWLQKSWKQLSLHKALQLSTTGCLGPCNLKNVIGIITRDMQLWIGGLADEEQYAALLEWFKKSADAGYLIELPAILKPHSFDRFIA
ncbi:(2Fe-2S) ferredoxin domain-containing protein [Cohnella sp.]|uniref:(2Fe-2S) ferredoxin domain-containing protein n=1 Tax=Cohnella sp. TaxID=1883426 RepID=UPI00356382DC